MGRNARRTLRENTTPGERLEIGLELLDEEIERRIREMDVPEGSPRRSAPGGSFAD